MRTFKGDRRAVVALVAPAMMALTIGCGEPEPVRVYTVPEGASAAEVTPGPPAAPPAYRPGTGLPGPPPEPPPVQ